MEFLWKNISFVPKFRYQFQKFSISSKLNRVKNLNKSFENLGLIEKIFDGSLSMQSIGNLCFYFLLNRHLTKPPLIAGVLSAHQVHGCLANFDKIYSCKLFGRIFK